MGVHNDGPDRPSWRETLVFAASGKDSIGEVARISLIIIFMIWLSWSPGEEGTTMVGPTHGYTALFGAMGVLLLGMGLYSR